MKKEKKEMRVPVPVRRTESESPKVVFVLAKQNTKKHKENMFVSESVSSYWDDQRSKNLKKLKKQITLYGEQCSNRARGWFNTWQTGIKASTGKLHLKSDLCHSGIRGAKKKVRRKGREK